MQLTNVTEINDRMATSIQVNSDVIYVINLAVASAAEEVGYDLFVKALCDRSQENLALAA